ncbi:MAG: hypothetical protein IT537_30825, partial [Hyphomicrobiales bacterium]|nr:hypothetical protein [Hyphomicrobiales bacterium]
MRRVTVDRTGQESWSSFADTYRADGSLAEQRVFNRDGSRIVSEFNQPGGSGEWDERHTVINKDGGSFTFEVADDVQRIYDRNHNIVSASVWTDAGPEPMPADQLALAGSAIKAGATAFRAIAPAARNEALSAAIVLFAWLSGR